MLWQLSVACLLGFLAGLGVGGGSLLILWLTLVMGMDSAAARGINLLFFLPSASICCWFRTREGTLPWKKLLLPIAAGCAAAAICAWIGIRMDTSVLKKGFGTLLLLTGVRELLYKPRP